MRIDQFRGLNTANDPYEVGFSGFTRADNVDLSRNGSFSRRKGRTKVYNGVIDAAWGDGTDFIFVEGNALKRLNPDYTATTLVSGLAHTGELYATRNVVGWLYWSTGVAMGVIVEGANREWKSSDDTYWTDTEDDQYVVSETYQEPMPVGAQLLEYAGRLWAVFNTSMLVYTHPYSEATDLRENFIPVGEPITNVGAVTDGLVVTTPTRVYFLAGRNPREMNVVEKAKYGGLKGTMTRVDGQLLGQSQNDIGLLWASSRGICVALPGGSVANLTEKEIDEIPGERGTAFLRKQNGQHHYVAVLQN